MFSSVPTGPATSLAAALASHFATSLMTRFRNRAVGGLSFGMFGRSELPLSVHLPRSSRGCSGSNPALRAGVPVAVEGGDEVVPGRVVAALQALRFRALQGAFALALLLQLDKGAGANRAAPEGS